MEKLVSWPYGSEGDLTIEGWPGRRITLPAKITFRFSCKQFAKVFRKFRKRWLTESSSGRRLTLLPAWWFNRFIGSKTFIRTFFRMFGCSVRYSFATFWCIQYTNLNRGYTAAMFYKKMSHLFINRIWPCQLCEIERTIEFERKSLIELSVLFTTLINYSLHASKFILNSCLFVCLFFFF